jgi:hypothetical protein
VRHARSIVRRLEGIVGGLRDRQTRRHVEPVDLGGLLTAHTIESLVDGPAGPVAPNRHVITVAGEPADPADVGEVEVGLATVLAATALERGWRLEGPIEVEIRFAEHDLEPQIDSVIAPGDLEMWARLDQVAGEATAGIRHGRAVIGRAGDADVHLEDDTVSRRHALVVRREGAVWLTDLGSSNGTYLNGSPVSEPVDIVAGDVLGFGEAVYTYRPIEPSEAGTE